MFSWYADSKVRAKLGDMGLSRKARFYISENLQSWRWMPPEAFNTDLSKPYTLSADIYSIAMVMIEVCHP